ncbi:hypothetical protein RMS29_016725 [Agrobacterium rosae]|uniref:hypothetical protein n=1 Tax=Agrobacterium rosae TaxID=1972867 RepID=UPI0011B39963|nr:hypothetical protein [Agrobacterium rosae]
MVRWIGRGRNQAMDAPAAWVTGCIVNWQSVLFERAIVMRRPKPYPIHHSDCSNQYCSIDYHALQSSKK